MVDKYVQALVPAWKMCVATKAWLTGSNYNLLLNLEEGAVVTTDPNIRASNFEATGATH